MTQPQMSVLPNQETLLSVYVSQVFLQEGAYHLSGVVATLYPFCRREN